MWCPGQLCRGCSGPRPARRGVDVTALPVTVRRWCAGVTLLPALAVAVMVLRVPGGVSFPLDSDMRAFLGLVLMVTLPTVLLGWSWLRHAQGPRSGVLLLVALLSLPAILWILPYALASLVTLTAAFALAARFRRPPDLE